MKRSPRTPATPARIAAAIALGFSATVACAAVTAPGDARSAEVQPLTGSTSASSADALSQGGNNKYPGCPHGALEDPHRGFIRCLAPGEKSPFAPEKDGGAPPDAAPAPDGGAPPPGSGPGKTPPLPPLPPADAGPSAPPDPPKTEPPKTEPPKTEPPKTEPPKAEPPKPGPLPVVEMKAPRFEGGEAPRAEKNLGSQKVLDAIAKCVSEAGGLPGKTGSFKVELLVRARGKAEGVEVTPTGVPAESARCVRTLLKDRSLGVPTADPTGVTVIYTLKPSAK